MGSPRAKTKRTPTGTFAPGVSGNPGGRPAGVVAKIKAQTRDGDEILEFLLAVMRGTLQSDHVSGESVILAGPATRERLDAAKWLDVRLNGKPVDQIQISELETRAKRYLDMSRKDLAAALAAALKENA